MQLASNGLPMPAPTVGGRVGLLVSTTMAARFFCVFTSSHVALVLFQSVLVAYYTIICRLVKTLYKKQFERGCVYLHRPS